MREERWAGSLLFLVSTNNGCAHTSLFRRYSLTCSVRQRLLQVYEFFPFRSGSAIHPAVAASFEEGVIHGEPVFKKKLCDARRDCQAYLLGDTLIVFLVLSWFPGRMSG
jgi:hypothetical protein